MNPVNVSDPVEISFLVGDQGRSHAYVTSTSFEYRCLGATQRLCAPLSSFSPAHVALIDYDSEGDDAVLARSRALKRQLTPLLKKLSGHGNVDTIEMAPHDLLDSTLLFEQWIEALPCETHLTLDITTLTKPHVMQFLNSAIFSRTIARISLLYTKGFYAKPETISWGALEPTILPRFGSAKRPDDPSSLIVFCGMEPNRSYAVIKQYSSAIRGCVIFVDPGSEYPGNFVGRVRKWHEFAERRGFSEEIVKAYMPLQTSHKLSSIIDSFPRSEHVLISPLSTKWEAVATWMYFINNPEAYASVVYSSPGRYNADAYSQKQLGRVIRSDITFSK